MFAEQIPHEVFLVEKNKEKIEGKFQKMKRETKNE